VIKPCPDPRAACVYTQEPYERGLRVILGFSRLFGPDQSEQLLPTVTEARALIADSDWPSRIEAVMQRVQCNDGRIADAFTLSLARLGHRHGGFGNDPHAYHNEHHIMELAERRIPHLIQSLGVEALPAEDWHTLVLFAAFHDLRQREDVDVPGPVGGNEAASVAESFRILEQCGFSQQQDRALFVAIELMIAGSTFNAGVNADIHADAGPVMGGCFARSLGPWLDIERKGWREDLQARRGERLARLAADIDTANVGEAFHYLADSAERLCREREMRADSDINRAISAPSALGFLTRGQLVYFFDLHRFASREGERVFGPQKAQNAAKVREVSAGLAAHYSDSPPMSGQAVIEIFRQLAAD
jgi:hypothetical protein